MAGRIRQEDVEAVKERTDIVALVSQYLALKKTGHDSMSGLCPFHQEKTPSFSVSPAKGVFYCFGVPGGRRFDQVPTTAGEPLLRRGGRAARPARRRDAQVRGGFGGGTASGGPAHGLVPCKRGRREPLCTDAARRARGRGRARVRDGAWAFAGVDRGLRDRVRARLPGLPAATALQRLRPRGPGGGGARHQRRGRRSAIGSAAGSRSRSRTSKAGISGSGRGSCRATREPGNRRST